MVTEQRILEAVLAINGGPKKWPIALSQDDVAQTKAIIDRLERDGHMPMAGLEADVMLWGKRTFPEASPASILAHLKEEVDELAEAIAAGNKGQGCVEVGIADVGLLLIQLAWKFDTTLALEMSHKHAINKTRTFTYRPELGYSKAVKDGDEGAPDADNA